MSESMSVARTVKVGTILITVMPIVWLPANSDPAGKVRTIKPGSFLRVLAVENGIGDDPDRVVLQIVGYEWPEYNGLPEVSIGSWSEECFKH